MVSQEEDVFSIRIVSLDYYMSPPIPDLDFCYSSFRGTKVEEVPVVRIYGATPAGQKTCLHVHRALPYFYVPFPEDILQSPEEGQAFIRFLSSAIENTLRLRGFSTSKRQHVYGCSLVKAKKLYGYHSSEELFVKIVLYRPHDITRIARLLLDGSVLGKSLQPYESHIPYLLQFLVDYNLYGMSHIHASKVKFRSPLVYCYNGTSLRPRNILETLDSNTCEKPKGWLSPTEFTGPLDSPGNECAQLIKRQSICQLEADACVEDIINEKFKIYTSLSQARLNLRMVQSLVPIWEEEYERSGIQEQSEQDNPNKLHPDRVLRYFLHELNYDKTLIELCMKFERMRDQRHAKSCDVSLACGDTENRSREALSSQSLTKEDLKDNDALRLLYCLASSQAEDEMVTGDELLHEAILSPLIPVNPNSMALEIAYRDYEHASQLECQDILDSVESILNLERSEEEASSFLQDHTLNSLESFIKSEGSKEHNLSSSHDILDSVSSGACNFQIHGPIDENLKTPQKGNSFEARISYGGEKANAQPGRIGPVVSSQSKEKKLLGNLPVCPSRSEHGASESFCVAAFSHDEIIDNGFYNSQFHNAEFIQYYGLRTELGSEICSKNGGMTSGLCSTRDLMRKRRSIRIEYAEAEVQIDEVVPYMLKERPTASVGEGLHLFIEEPFIGHSAILQSAKGTACSTTVCSDIHRREYFEDQTLAWRTCTVQNALSSLCTDKMQSSIVPSEITVVNQRSHLNEQLKNSIASLNLAVGDLSVLETVPLKMFEVSEVKAVGSVSRAFFCGQHRDERPGCPPSLNKCQFKLNESCTGNNALKSIRYKRWNSDFPESNNANDSDGSIPQETPFPKRPHNGCQRSTYLSDENCRDFCKEISHEIIEMTFISKPPSNGHILGPDESLPVDQTDGNIVKIQGTKNILPFFPRIFQDANAYDENVFINEDSALGVPIHFQNDGSVLYLLTHAQSPPTLITVCDWLSVQQQHCLLEETGASSCQTSPSAAVGWSQYDSSQSNKQKFSPETKNIYPNIGHISSEAKLDIIPEKVEVHTKNLHDLSQISGPEKYENSNPTPLSQIGFQDSASVGGEQQLTLISLELLAESRGNLRPDPKFDAIKILSLVVQEDTSTASQVYVLIHVINEKSSEINGNGVPDCNMFFFTEEKLLLEQFVDIISYVDPDILMGWETKGCSLGYLTERAVYLGMNMLEKISRTPFHERFTMDLLHSNLFDALPEATVAKTVLENSVMEDEWASAHTSSLHVGGRIVLNIWRLMRFELKLNMYTAEAVAEVVLRQKIPLFSNRTLNEWYSSGIGRARDKCMRYIIERAILNILIMNQLDMINRTSQLARIFGIDFSSVISRGSQFRVESMLLRLAHTQNYLAISPGYQQVASQPAMECLPLVMEPESGFYSDPVVVLDFQSLYPSMIIAYNLCFCTCLGNALTASSNTLGVSSYSPDVQVLKDFSEKLRLTPNGVLYVPPEVRKGVLPRLLEEILSTRIMVKQAMKKLKSSQLVLHKILNARQLALKLISNVTYGYTAAGFSGRMPCAEIADSIVQCGRRTLETAITFVNQHKKWNAKVIYGDTDSMFVLLKGRSKEDAFIIGNEIASVITSMNPEPVALKMEKVYQPCFLLTKKRYVGYSYVSPEQEKPAFDAKGIETVRRDTCPAVAKILERSIRLFFESKNLAEIRSYVERQWTRILSGKISLKDFVFAKEVRLGTYSKASSLPPAAIVAKKAMGIDPRARPHYGERVPYVVVHGEPGSLLIDMVVNPLELLNLNSPFRLNDLYYINKQIIPALQRVFCFFGVDMHQWFSAVPRPTRRMLTKCNAPMLVSRSFNEDSKGDPTVSKKPQAKRIRIDAYYSLKHCYLCDGDLIQSSEHFCVKCLNKMSLVAATVAGRTSKREREIQHLAEICRHCGGGDWIVESGVKCISLTCSVTYERQKVLKELQYHSSFATNAGFYPPCNAELF